MSSDYNAILHIGAPKCGSSSLQRHLSMHPEFVSCEGVNYKYISITSSGDVLHGQELKKLALLSPNGLSKSSRTMCNDFDPSNLGKSAAQIHKILKAGTRVIASHEGWLHNAQFFRQHQVLEKLGIRPKVIMFIRPPLDWLNSAWWQGGAWSGKTFDEWYETAVERVMWFRHFHSWQNLPLVQEVELQTATVDVVESFGGYINCDWPSSPRTNVSSSGSLLRFLQHNRQLRKNPGTEYSLNRWVTWPREPTPWVIPKEHQEKTFEMFLPQFKKLLLHVSPNTRARLNSDARYWSSQPYDERKVEDAIAELSSDKRDELIKSLIKGIVELDKQYRRLSSKKLTP
jgi:hypothetical protein